MTTLCSLTLQLFGSQYLILYKFKEIYYTTFLQLMNTAKQKKKLSGNYWKILKGSSFYYQGLLDQKYLRDIRTLEEPWKFVLKKVACL